MDMDDKQIKFLRDKSFYKYDSRSDFVTIKECFEASKHLYEALKYFDSRVTRYASQFDSYSQKMHHLKRRRSFPSEYYSFKCFDVCIEIRIDRRTRNYVIYCSKFNPIGFEIVRSDMVSDILASAGAYLCCPTKSFEESLQNFNNVVASFFETHGVFAPGFEDRFIKKMQRKNNYLPF